MARDFPELTRAASQRGTAFVSLPLVAEGMKLGAMHFGFPRHQPIDPDVRALAVAFASLTAQALARARTHERYRLLVENSADVIARTSLDGIVLDISTNCAKLLDRTRAQMLGRPIAEFVEGDDRARLLDARRSLRQGAPGYVVTLRRERVDGSVVWMEIHAQAARDARGETTEVVSVMRDVTTRMATEAREQATLGALRTLQKVQAELLLQARHSEERWRGLVENAPIQILTVDKDGIILTANRRILAGQADAILGMSLFAATLPKDRERVRRIVLEVIRTGEPAEYEASVEVAGSAERWFHVRVAPLGEGAVILNSEITQRKRDEAEIALVRAQLIQGEKLAALGSLVSGVAHELRTPLTFIANNTFLAQQRLHRAAARGASAKEALDETDRMLSEIGLGVDRINQIVEDLRRYTRARHDASLAVATLDAIVADAVELFKAANRATHPVETTLLATPPVRANKGALQQLVLNLLQNAAEASAPGSPLRVTTRGDGARAVLEVADHGVGMPPQTMQRMFDPLFTTKEEGTGLGLSIVKRIADEHRAAIACESETGKGTLFRVTFPRAD